MLSYKPVVSLLNRSVKHEKASGSTAMISSNIVKELEIAKYRITFGQFPLCYI